MEDCHTDLIEVNHPEPADVKALLGKKRCDDILGGLTYKPPGKPTLVPESDKRPALDTAKNDFEEENTNE